MDGLARVTFSMCVVRDRSAMNEVWRGIGISGGSPGEWSDDYFTRVAVNALGGEFGHTPAWDRKRVGD